MNNVSMNNVANLTYSLAASTYGVSSLQLLENAVRYDEQFGFLRGLYPPVVIQDPMLGRVIDILI
jgi:hypothetical protein